MASTDPFPVRIAAVTLLGIMAVVMTGSAWDDTLTSDEAAHIGAGYSYLTRADLRLNPEHPPLLKDLAGLPLLFLNLAPDWNHASWTEPFGQWEFGHRLVFNSGGDPDTITRAARAPMIVFTLAFGAALFVWTRRRFGDATALLALFLFSFSPTMIAHGRLVTTDVGAAAGLFVATIALLHFFDHPTRRNLLLAGLAVGFAFLTKFSTFLLLPIALILAVVWALREAPPAGAFLLCIRKSKSGSLTLAFRASPSIRVLSQWLGQALGILVIGFLVIYAVYLYHTWNYPPERQQSDAIALLAGRGVGHTPKDMAIWASDKPALRPWAQYFSGLFHAVQRSAEGNASYFLGEIREHGSPWYFPFVYLVKEPLALHVLTVLALIFALSGFWREPVPKQASRSNRLRAWLNRHFTEFAFLMLLVVYWAAAMRSHLNIGVRHLAPVLPLVFVLVASQVTLLYRSLAGKAAPRRWLGFALGVLLAWQAVSVLRIYPSYIPYFNELAGGPERGWQYVSDSNADWGQDLKRLAEFVEQRGIPEIHLDYFGGAEPGYYLKGKFQGISSCSEPRKGWIAVSAFLYQGWRARPECDYRVWLPTDKLVTKIGYAIFVFYNE